MKIRPKKAYAVVSKKNPQIKILDVFQDQDIKITKDERIIRVMISAVGENSL